MCSCSTIVPPWVITAKSALAQPKLQKSEMPIHIRSAGVRRWRSPMCHMFSMSPPWASCTPFGVEVVPEV
jgi:hypothetical protein